LAALSLLETAAREGISDQVLDPRNRVTFWQPGTYRRCSSGYRYFSLVPVDQTLEQVTIRGAKYPLESATVYRGHSLTISNEFLGQGPVEISFAAGCCYYVEAT
jgi:thiamine pyrophosphokinase